MVSRGHPHRIRCQRLPHGTDGDGVRRHRRTSLSHPNPIRRNVQLLNRLRLRRLQRLSLGERVD